MSSAQQITLYTVGHSTHSLETFLKLLQQHAITAVADVRSTPFSRYTPQFNKDKLPEELNKHNIAYVFAGEELGARPKDASCYEQGKVCYERLARTSNFRAGIDRVLSGAKKYRVALMCAEKAPLGCHRTLLVSRALAQRGVTITHILPDGASEDHQEMMRRLRTPQGDMFSDREEQFEEAGKGQEQEIACRDTFLAH